MKVTVYTGPNCHKCEITKTQLGQLGVSFNEVDLTERPDLAAEFKNHGMGALPVVEVVHHDGRIDYWNDYRYTRIKELAVER
jgi:glutaredoxin-like protein NrdH